VNWRPIILVVLVIALAGVIVYTMGRKPAGYDYEPREEAAGGQTTPAGVAGQPAAAPALKTIDAAKPAGVGKDSDEEKPFIYTVSKLRNPMAPLLAKPKKGAATTKAGAKRPVVSSVKHKLGGIIWSDTNPYAIIDGNAVGVGEKLRDGSLVAEIGRDFVALKSGGKTFRLVLK
jgi:hypothetical protein